MSLKPFPTDRCEWQLFHGTVNVTHLQYDIAKWWIWWANADVSRKTFCQSSSSDVSIQGSSLGHRQITLQSMVVLSRRLTMGSYSSCVGMQMSTRTYTNAQSVSHLGGWGGGCKMGSQGSQGVKITITHFQQFNSSVFVSHCHNLKSGWILSWAEAIPRRRCGTIWTPRWAWLCYPHWDVIHLCTKKSSCLLTPLIMVCLTVHLQSLCSMVKTDFCNR